MEIKSNKIDLMKKIIKKTILDSHSQDTNSVVTSVNDEGYPNSRQLRIFFEKNELFFITRSNSSIVNDLKKNDKLSIAFYTPISPLKHKDIGITPEYKCTNFNMEHVQINLFGKAKLENLNENKKDGFYDTKIIFEIENVNLSNWVKFIEGERQDFIEYKKNNKKINIRRLNYGNKSSRNVAKNIDKQNDHKVVFHRLDGQRSHIPSNVEL